MRRLLFTVILVFIAGTASARDPSVIQIMERNYEVNRTRDRSIEITMQMLSDSGKKRIRRLTNRALLMKDGINEKRLIRFHFPPDLEGAGFLVLEQSDGDDHMWLYLPTLRKSRRKLASDKKDSFLGTEFSYGDITGPKVSEYTYVLKGEEKLDGFPCWVIESTPASDDVLKDYGYSKRTDYIRKDTYTHQKAMFYDPDGERLKTLTCSDPYEADPENHKWFIKKRVMENHQNGRKTILQMDNIQINIGIEDKEFSVRYLERGR
jgi:outer membrane lipoprotein-sorting protein